uniref:Uncharacterized protein n=1 Tax=Cyclophora tenuis TaxID=216820 RepID=A0A7S1DAT9_CYCTE
MQDVVVVMTHIINTSMLNVSAFLTEDRRRRRRLVGTKLYFNEEHSNVENVSLSIPSETLWWKYIVGYYLEANENQSDIETKIRSALNTSILDGLFLEELRDRVDKVVGVAQPGYEENSTLFVYVRGENDPIYVSDLDVTTWDIRRWVGLGIFCGTLLLTLALTRTARKRRKKWEEQENWGIRLATEHDINELLTYGWQHDGQQLTLYDKTKLGYRDDDSMLIGGPYPPREITSPSSGASQ